MSRSLTSLVEAGDTEKLAEKLEVMSENESDCYRFTHRNDRGHTILDLAALLGRHQMAALLVEKGADVNNSNSSGYTALHFSAAWGRLECLQTLLELGSKTSSLTRHQETPRDIAQRYGHTECVDYLDWTGVKRKLQDAVKEARELVGNSTGKWNKEDRGKVLALCNEYTEWLEQSKHPSIAQLEQQKDEFQEKFQPYLTKLEPT